MPNAPEQFDSALLAIKSVGDLNTFELISSANAELLHTIFKEYKVVVENAGTTFIISVGKEISNEVFLSTLISNKISVNYFRDISNSTRKLFHKDT